MATGGTANISHFVHAHTLLSAHLVREIYSLHVVALQERHQQFQLRGRLEEQLQPPVLRKRC